jgi:hypothetical protein
VRRVIYTGYRLSTIVVRCGPSARRVEIRPRESRDVSHIGEIRSRGPSRGVRLRGERKRQLLCIKFSEKKRESESPAAAGIHVGAPRSLQALPLS